MTYALLSRLPRLGVVATLFALTALGFSQKSSSSATVIELPELFAHRTAGAVHKAIAARDFFWQGLALRLRGGERGSSDGAPWDVSMLSREIQFPHRELSDEELLLANKVAKFHRVSELAGFSERANMTQEDISDEIEFQTMDDEGELHNLDGISTQKLIELGDEEDWYTDAGCQRKMEEIALRQRHDAERAEARALARRYAEIERDMLNEQRKRLHSKDTGERPEQKVQE